MSHGDRVTQLPAGFTVKATSENAPYAVASDEARRFYSTMFHPEVVHTPDGGRLLRNFVVTICGCTPDWSMAAYRAEMQKKIRDQVGTGRVICGLSGGVDSAVAAVLIHEAIGDQLTCVFVDHGLMRMNEAEEVVRLFRDTTTSRWFMLKPKSCSSPSSRACATRRPSARPSARLFIDVFDAEAKKIGGADFLAQGTLYPDVIESVSF